MRPAPLRGLPPADLLSLVRKIRARLETAPGAIVLLHGRVGEVTPLASALGKSTHIATPDLAADLVLALRHDWRVHERAHLRRRGMRELGAQAILHVRLGPPRVRLQRIGGAPPLRARVCQKFG